MEFFSQKLIENNKNILIWTLEIDGDLQKYEFSPFNGDYWNIHTSFSDGGSSSQSISIVDLKLKLIELLHDFSMNWFEDAKRIIN